MLLLVVIYLHCAVSLDIVQFQVVSLDGGLDLTPFSRLVDRHPDGEVHFVQLNVMLAHRQLLLRLAVAGFPRTPLDDGTCPHLSEMQLVAVPAEMHGSSLVLTSGQILFPFEDSPHITHDGVLLHGRCAPQRAMVYRILQQAECLSPHGWAVGRGQVLHHRSRPSCCHKVVPFPPTSSQPELVVTRARPKPVRGACKR